MTIRLGVVMDPIGSIHYKKDSTLAMLWDAAARGWEIYYFEQKDLFLGDGIVYGDAKRLIVYRDPHKWYAFINEETLPLAELNVILMRKDPPFDAEYIYTTYLLEHAEKQGVRVVNRPRALRDFNEKIAATYFPQCAPATIVTKSKDKLHDFWQYHGDIVCKPLHGMGGKSVFRLVKNDVNANVIFDTLTTSGEHFIMAQTFIPEIVKGDKRILMINGQPVAGVLARVPHGNDWRGNLAVGAQGVIQPLSDRDRFICEQVGPTLKENGLYFVGLDVIGDYLTEINVTSPTGIREVDAGLNINISAALLDEIEKTLTASSA